MTAPATTPADVLVIFGITGDLARKMTFRSLYRLERRRLLDCPIVGVALDNRSTTSWARNVQPYAPGSWGPPAGARLLAGHPGWREPWLPS